MILEHLLTCAIDESGTLPVMIPAPGGDFVEVTGCEVAELDFLTGGTGLAFLLTSEESKPKRVRVQDSEPIHDWFELSYAQYLTIPRSVLQSMTAEWQQRMVQCLTELDEAIDWRPAEGRYVVQLRNDTGQFVHDPLMDYERGRRRVPERSEDEAWLPLPTPAPAGLRSQVGLFRSLASTWKRPGRSWRSSSTRSHCVHQFRKPSL